MSLLAFLTGTGVGAAQEALPTIDIGAAGRGAATWPSLSAEVGPASSLPQDDPENSQRLDRLLPKSGANVYSFDRAAIEALPQGEQTTLDKILLQAPGVTQDSAAGGNFHIRNEHANVQYRVNGILLPDGVSGFSQMMETSFIGSVSLITGALPAQYGLRMAGLVDIVSRPPPPTPSGGVTFYGGSRETGQTAFEYGARSGNWEVFATGRLTMNSLGIENPTPGHEAIHDRTRQGRFFGYASYAIDDATRLSFLTGTSISKFQIPNNPGQQPQFTAFGTNWFDSSTLDDNQVERNFYNVVALTHSSGDIDTQLSYFSRYSTVHFVPDQVGDLVFNGVASNVYRSGLVNGLQGDVAYQNGDFRAYANLAWARQRATQVTSNQFLLEADELAYIANHYVYTDHAQTWTGSAGASYVFLGTRASVDMIYGSGLRSGFANTMHVSPYTQVNFGLSRELSVPWGKPLTLRFDVVNLFDRSYVLRDGSGIGVFAPQYGPRRGFFAGMKQAF